MKKEIELKEKIELLNEIANRKTEFTPRQIQLIKGFILNILTSKSVMNRYETSRYGNFIENNLISLYDCIEYISNDIANGDDNELIRKENY